MFDLRFFCRIADNVGFRFSRWRRCFDCSLYILYYGLPLALAILFSVAGFFLSFAGLFSSVASILFSLPGFLSPLAAGSLVFDPGGPLRRGHLHVYFAQSSSDSSYHFEASSRCFSAKFDYQSTHTTNYKLKSCSYFKFYLISVYTGRARVV